MEQRRPLLFGVTAPRGSPTSMPGKREVVLAGSLGCPNGVMQVDEPCSIRAGNADGVGRLVALGLPRWGPQKKCRAQTILQKGFQLRRSSMFVVWIEELVEMYCNLSEVEIALVRFARPGTVGGGCFLEDRCLGDAWSPWPYFKGVLGGPGLQFDLTIFVGKNKMEDYPQLTKFCYIVEELHEEYGLRLQGLLPKDITKDILSKEQWLIAFKFKHQKGAKIYVSHVHPHYIDDCRLLFHTMYQAPPSCGEITAKFSQGYAFERCHAATKDLVGHTVAWAHFGENVIKMCDTRTRSWSRRLRLGERQIVSLRVPVTAGKSLAFHSLAASYAQRLRPLVFQVDEEDVKLPYQEVQTTKTESLKNGGPGLEKVVVMDVEDQAMDSVGMNAVDSTTIDVDMLPKEQTKFARASTIDINMLHDDSPKFEKNCEIEGVLLDAAEAMAEVDALRKKLEGFFDERKKERAVDNGMNGAAQQSDSRVLLQWRVLRWYG
ncbi:hypothetical protein L7F22_036528 [Adiantum nelumboides]|nr:hypothetical protein [Adiantum nelumboides]